MTINVVEAAAISRERIRKAKATNCVQERQREKKTGFLRLVQSIWYSFELESVGETISFEISDQACSCRAKVPNRCASVCDYARIRCLFQLE